MRRIFAKSIAYINTVYKININFFTVPNPMQMSMELYAYRKENILRRMIKGGGWYKRWRIQILVTWVESKSTTHSHREKIVEIRKPWRKFSSITSGVLQSLWGVCPNNEPIRCWTRSQVPREDQLRAAVASVGGQGDVTHMWVLSE
jgi:hypothetical protein